jgi:hypothetical protein
MDSDFAQHHLLRERVHETAVHGVGTAVRKGRLSAKSQIPAFGRRTSSGRSVASGDASPKASTARKMAASARYRGIAILGKREDSQLVKPFGASDLDAETPVEVLLFAADALLVALCDDRGFSRGDIFDF